MSTTGLQAPPRRRAKARRYGRGIIRRTAHGTYRAEINHAYKRHRKTFPTEAQARAWIDAQLAQLDNLYAPLDVWTLREAAEAKALLPQGVSLLDAARFYVQERGAELVPRRLIEAVSAFLADRERAGLRPATLHQYRMHLRRLCAAFPDASVGDLTAADLNHWLDKHSIRGRTRANYRTSFSALFEWCIRLGHAIRNPARSITTHIVDESTPGIYSADETAALFRAAEKSHPELCGFLALGFFAGIRTQELMRLTWDAVNSEHVHIGPQVAKRRRRRFVTVLSNLRRWIEAYRGAGPVAPVRERALRRRLRRLVASVGLTWPHNVARHSFASHHLALFQDAPRTAFELGHTSPNVLYNHYRNLVTPEEGRAYFQIHPSDLSSICPGPP